MPMHALGYERGTPAPWLESRRRVSAFGCTSRGSCEITTDRESARSWRHRIDDRPLAFAATATVAHSLDSGLGGGGDRLTGVERSPGAQ